MKRSSASRIVVRSPISLPLGASIGVRRTRPAAGSRDAISRSSAASAPGPEISYLLNELASRTPAELRAARHSAPTGANAFERRRLGISSAGSRCGAK